jgi:molecular chaperone DnaJ
MAKDYYKILGVPKEASQEDIKKAYRRLAHQHHPDKGGGDEQKFKELNEAYQVLGSPEKRKQYDQFGTAFEGMGGPGFDFSNFRGGFGPEFEVNVEDLFGDFFGQRRGGTAGGARRRVRRGKDIVLDVELTLEEAFRGTVKEVEIRKFVKCSRCRGEGAEPGSSLKTCETCGGRGEIKDTQRTFFGLFSQVRQCPTCAGEGEYPERPCRECGGDGRVRQIEKLTIPIPAGVDTDNLVRISTKGEEGPRKGVAGDLIVRVMVRPHEHFEREGEHLFSKLEISFPEAVFGATKEARTIEGNVDLKIPQGIESGTQLRLKDRGMPTGKGGRGDQYVTVKVRTPKKLSSKAKKLIEELKGELD